MTTIMIKALVMDVDGTLTDGKIYIGSTGEIMKAFSVLDGFAIVHMLPKLQIIPIVLTGRSSAIVEIRCSELGIKHCYQDVTDKSFALTKLLSTLDISFDEVAYIGDDLNDLSCMKLCGLRLCPANAAAEVVEVCDFAAARNGGDGAVRECIEWIEKSFF